MKTNYLLIAAASAMLMTSCGGSNTGDTTDSTVQEEVDATPVTVTVDEIGSEFVGDMGDYAAIIPGQYTLTQKGSRLELNLKFKALEESSDDISGSSFVMLADNDGNELERLYLYGGQTALNNAIHNSDFNGEYELTFTTHADDAKAVMEKVKKVKAGELKVSTSSSTSSSSTSAAGLDGSGLSKTLSEYGVTYECVHDPVENDEFVKNFDPKKALKDKDMLIQAWEIYQEEMLRYQFAPGKSGMDNPEAFARYNKIDGILHPGDGYSDDDPIGYMQNREYSFGTSEDFTPAQRERLTKFMEKLEKARDDWRAAEAKN